MVRRERHAVHDVEQLGYRLGTQHADACLAEVGDALEQGGGSQMATAVEDATVLDDALDDGQHT